VSIQGHRKEYGQSRLIEEEADPDPIAQFKSWYAAAAHSSVFDPNVMALATATVEGRPSVRMVLLRGFDSRGFQFFTNYDSRKARELDANPCAAVVFFWNEAERQVRIEGRAERVTAGESDAYFTSRPRGARIGAWASPQSEVVSTRELLESQFSSYETQFEEENIPRPPNWGGYRLVPTALEFWQGRPNRLHDRLLYTRLGPASWRIERLAP
jgi:pyridoxamine 5'-phosphate oxidase